MLVLSREVGEKICIGDNIVICLVDTKCGKARIGIDAPENIPVHREEIYSKIKAQKNGNGGSQ